MSQIIDGKAIAAQIKDELKEEVMRMRSGGISAALAVIQVGRDPASSIYVNNKKKACEYVGIHSEVYELPEEVSQEELLALVGRLNRDDKINGILVQLPLPGHINEESVITAISPQKDVDGFHTENAGRLMVGKKCIIPCTPAGIIQLIKRSCFDIEGKECVVIGRSNIVGKPMAALLLQENGTVTVAHSKTAHLKEVSSRADILVAAIGKPKFITADYVKEGAVVIDVGIHRMADRKMCGDVDFDSVYKKAAAITPVPGGVGPMTIAMLLCNCVEAAKR